MVNLNNSKIIVTGGNGFIGSNFIKLILSKYENLSIINIDKMGIGSRSLNLEVMENIDNGNLYLEIPEDVRNIDELKFNINLVTYVDYIFHFAAESHVDRSISGPSPFIENNVMGMVALLEWARKNQSKTKIVNISTDEVFGHLLNRDETPFTEASIFNPRSPYSASKASADLIANSYVSTYGMDIITTHCCNNFGEHQADEKFIPTVIRNLVRGEEIPVYGSGENIREWIHVDDHNKSLLEIAGGDFKHTNHVNIGSWVEKNNLEMIEDIAKIMGTTAKIKFVEDRKGHDFRYAIESIYYERKFELKDYYKALAETVKFYEKKYKDS